MSEDKQPVQLSLFPSKASIAEVIAEGKAMLPIESENDLVTLLETHKNTVLKLARDELSSQSASS